MGVRRPLEAPDAIPPPAAAWCPRCGLAFSDAAILRDLALVLAAAHFVLPQPTTEER